jgi:hypothetical protein
MRLVHQSPSPKFNGIGLSIHIFRKLAVGGRHSAGRDRRIAEFGENTATKEHDSKQEEQE